MVNFKQLLEKATSPAHSDPDWEAILEIVEEIKSKSVTMKTVMKEFRKRLLDNDPTVLYYTLLVLDSVMKNCSTDVHTEVLSKEFMNIVKEIIVSSKSGAKTVDKALELVGEWKVAFGAQANYKAVVDVFFELEREGFHVPETQVASAAFMKKPPEFDLNDKCYACRQEFNRFKGHFRHHCRNCGKSVCTQCSGKRAPLMEFGIDMPTRVCDICFKKLDSGTGTGTDTATSSSNSDLPPEYLRSTLAKEVQTTAPAAASSDTQVQEDDDLQLAIAMSLNEAENKDKSPPKRAPSPSVSISSTTPSAPPPPASTLYASIVHNPIPASQPPPTTYYNGGHTEPADNSDPNLARYLDRNYWQQRKEQQVAPPTSTATGHTHTTTGHTHTDVGPPAMVLSEGASGSPLAESVRKTVEMFMARLQEVNSVGGSVATDPVILSHYQNLTALQPQLLKQIDDVQQKKTRQQEIIHKLDEAKEARVTLNRMRREHQDKVRQQEQEQTLLARMQMEQKLALLRQQKAEQVTFQQALQKQRLDDLQTQRSEYEQQLTQQREAERLQLIAKEQQVMHQQFGQGGAYGSRMEPGPVEAVPYGSRMEPGPVEAVPFHSLSLNPAEQVAPLPMKVDYEPAPPPYHPAISKYSQPPYNDGLYQPALTSQPLSYQQPVSMTSIPPAVAQPQVYGSGPSEMSYMHSTLGGPGNAYQPSPLTQPPQMLTQPPPQPHTLTQSQPHSFTQPPQMLTQPQPQPHTLTQPPQMLTQPPPQPHSLTQPQLMMGGQTFPPTQPDVQYQPQMQQYNGPPPTQFVPPQGGYAPAHHQPMGVANGGLAPPTTSLPLLISFD